MGSLSAPAQLGSGTPNGRCNRWRPRVVANPIPVGVLVPSGHPGAGTPASVNLRRPDTPCGDRPHRPAGQEPTACCAADPVRAGSRHSWASLSVVGCRHVLVRVVAGEHPQSTRMGGLLVLTVAISPLHFHRTRTQVRNWSIRGRGTTPGRVVRYRDKSLAGHFRREIPTELPGNSATQSWSFPGHSLRGIPKGPR